MKKLLLGSALCLISFQLHASEPRYSSWSDPNKEVSQQSDALKNMIQELNNLVKEAEQARAADPRFLQDLKNLTNRYGQTTVPRVTLQDDFADGNFTESPVWQVVSGKYWIEKGYGLRSFVDGSSTASNAGSSSARKVSKEELLIGVLGAVLGVKPKRNHRNKRRQPLWHPLLKFIQITRFPIISKLIWICRVGWMGDIWNLALIKAPIVRPDIVWFIKGGNPLPCNWCAIIAIVPQLLRAMTF
ncbi:hypothetical protein [Terasakiella sp.]|uniref:hypothetical protein n=1 Tax=Terasakiella sp. TaxID=2034861 RepID=UPI003B0011F4